MLCAFTGSDAHYTLSLHRWGTRSPCHNLSKCFYLEVGRGTRPEVLGDGAQALLCKFCAQTFGLTFRWLMTLMHSRFQISPLCWQDGNCSVGGSAGAPLCCYLGLTHPSGCMLPTTYNSDTSARSSARSSSPSRMTSLRATCGDQKGALTEDCLVHAGLPQSPPSPRHLPWAPPKECLHQLSPAGSYPATLELQ